MESKKNSTDEPVEGQEYRCRCREHTCGHRMGKERMEQIDRIALTYIHYRV